MVLATKWYLVPVVAAIWFAVYYAIFRFAITRFNLENAGPRHRHCRQRGEAVAGTIGKSGYNVPAILAALGGEGTLFRWITALPRLRLSVHDVADSGRRRAESPSRHRGGTAQPA